MPTTEQVPGIVEKVKHRLEDAEREGVYLKVIGEKFDDGWLDIAVIPSRPGVKALDYANHMSKIERQLRAEGDDHVMLVPVLED
jgi:hypothetical protein